MSAQNFETASHRDWFLPPPYGRPSGEAADFLAKLKADERPYESPFDLQEIGRRIFDRFAIENPEKPIESKDPCTSHASKQTREQILETAREQIHEVILIKHILSAEALLVHLETTDDAGLACKIDNTGQNILGHIKAAEKLGFGGSLDGKEHDFSDARINAAVARAHRVSATTHLAAFEAATSITEVRLAKVFGGQIEQHFDIARKAMNVVGQQIELLPPEEVKRRVGAVIDRATALDPLYTTLAVT